MRGHGEQAPQKHAVMELGEGVGLLGVMLRPVVDEATDELVIRLEMVGGPLSSIVGITPRNVPVGELARLPLAKVRAVLKMGASAVEPPAPTVEPPVDAPRLILGGKR